MDGLMEIQEIVDRETRAWDTQDTALLLTVFHPDMVWVWPPHPDAHDPVLWQTVLGRFDHARWSQIYSDMFTSFSLIHNERKTVKIVLSEQKDGAFAVVDIDTLWESRCNGTQMHWLGRVCKTYVKTPHGWKMIAQTGVLHY